MNVEEGVSIRAVRRAYAGLAGIPIDRAPDPKDIEAIALGRIQGNQEAALEAFRKMGEIIGDALGNALTLVDGLAVIGGGISNSKQLFFPALMEELNGTYTTQFGKRFRRLASVAFDLEDPEQLETFLKGEVREIAIPGSSQKIKYDPLQRIGVGMSRLGTSEAVAIGGYAFALQQLT